MKQSIILNSRQKELLLTLLNKKEPVTYKNLSEHFKLSTRTIQREMKSLVYTLKDFDIHITKKIGTGIRIQGSEENIATLRNHLKEARIMTAFSPEERREGITYDLLLTNEPLKQEYFSTKYGVSVATIAHDLNKVNTWLAEGDVIVERSPGIGIFITATEQQRRTLLSRLLHKDITFEDWLELFYEKRAEVNLYGKLGSVIRSRLLKFVQTDKILSLDRVLHEVLDEQVEITLNDRSYVNLMIHILLAMERIESGKVIEDTKLNQWEPFEPDTLDIARKIVIRLQQVSSSFFPDIEIKYIALHLAGAKATNNVEIKDDTNDAFLWIELTQSFIRSIEGHLDESFDGDQLLFEGLVSHFAPVFNRLKYDLQIHNPMLEEIKSTYPRVFKACAKACAMITEKTGYPIPEDEIGYLAMHIGASLLRIEEGMKESFTAVVVCASGLGTSMYLATRIRKETPNLQVEAIISVSELVDWLKNEPQVDVIISTVNIPVVTSKKTVIVSPFLKKEDIAKIRNTLINLIHLPKEPFMTTNKKPNVAKTTSLKSIATYGEGMLQILNNLKIYNQINITFNSVTSVLKLMKDITVIKDHHTLKFDLEEREKLGGFVLGELAMIHTKTDGVSSPLVALFRINHYIPWIGDDGAEYNVKTIILLVIPMDSPKEHMEAISEVSASFIDEDFVHILETGTKENVESVLEELLTKAFESRITSLLKGLEKG